MDIKMIIATNLESLRRTPDGALETLKSLAKRSGVSFSTLQRASKGEVNLTVENLEAIARAYRCAPGDLLSPPAAGATLPSAMTDYLLPLANSARAMPASESVNPYAWPFPLVSQRAYEALPAAGRAYVQGCLKQAIDDAARQFDTPTRKRTA